MVFPSAGCPVRNQGICIRRKHPPARDDAFEGPNLGCDDLNSRPATRVVVLSATRLHLIRDARHHRIGAGLKVTGESNRVVKEGI